MFLRTLGLGAAMTVYLFGCAEDRSSRDADGPERTRETGEELATATANVAARLDRALKLLDRGGDAKSAVADLDAVLADTRASLDQQDEARLGLSSARELLGDADGAVDALEELLQSHGDSGRFELRDVAEKRLRKLLTGREATGNHFAPSERYAPVARALAPYFKPDEKNATLIDIYAFGDKGGTHTDELGIFNIAGAKRDLFHESCSLCDENLDVGRSFSRAGSWTAIPRAMGEAPPDMPQIDRSMLVFYFDLGDDLVPSRYDEYLPIPSAEIVKHLEQGEGLIAFRERANAKPTIVIAAPRVAQLSAVEDAFAKLTEMPKTPVVVPLSVELKSEEIQGVIRGAKGDLRACYESLLKSDASASGSVVFEFTIGPDGAVAKIGVSEAKTTINDATFIGCATNVVGRLSFPATSKAVTVTYPLTFTPK